ncbi:unnamed protein product, partial [Ectocarpus sp. 12 AP-2014]
RGGGDGATDLRVGVGGAPTAGAAAADAGLDGTTSAAAAATVAAPVFGSTFPAEEGRGAAEAETEVLPSPADGKVEAGLPWPEAAAAVASAYVTLGCTAVTTGVPAAPLPSALLAASAAAALGEVTIAGGGAG